MSFHTNLKSILLLFVVFYAFYIYLTSQSPKEISSSHPPETETKTTRSEVTTEIPNLLTNKLIEKLEAQEKTLSVIILAVSPRSGSTYLADILASTPMTSLWQEPLRVVIISVPSANLGGQKSTKLVKIEQINEKSNGRDRLN